MECRCGYKGEPEWGTFPDPEWFITYHFRCPECKRSAHATIEAWERIEMALRFPEYCKGSVDFGPHEPVLKWVLLDKKGSYSITCPTCTWGEGGGFIPEPHLSRLRSMLGWKEFPPIPEMEAALRKAFEHTEG